MKTRAQGNAIVLTVPSKFNIPVNQEFIAFKGDNGSITYVPKQQNIFQEALEADKSLRTPLDEEYDYDIEE